MGTVLRLTTPASPPASARPEMLWREALGRQLRRERTRRGQRIADVADRAGVSPQYLSEIERGVKDPSSEIVAALAGALDLTVLDLVTSTVRDSRPQPSSQAGRALCLAA